MSALSKRSLDADSRLIVSLAFQIEQGLRFGGTRHAPHSRCMGALTLLNKTRLAEARYSPRTAQ